MSSWLNRLMHRVRAVLSRGRIDRELDAEMRLHVELETADIAQHRHVSMDEARRQALAAFGGLSHYAEVHRDARGWRWIEDSVQDVRYALRSLRRSPGFTLSSVVVLALGIGATTAVFSAVNAVLRDPQYDRLVIVFQQYSPTSWGTLSTVDYRAIEEQQRSFSDVGAVRWGEAGYMAGGDPARVRYGSATSGFFRAMRVRPVAGRGIEGSDEPVGAAAVAMVSHAHAVASLGGERAAIGRAVSIDGIAHTVIGVLPPGVTELAGIRADVWTALQLQPPTRRGPFGMRVVGRLRDDVSVDAATRDLKQISQRIFPLWSSGFQNSSAYLNPVPMRKALLGDASNMLAIFGAAVALVLLIAIANVASLMLVRAVARAREVSLRSVLGASRLRLVRLLVTESLTLAMMGALAGIGTGTLGLKALVAIGPHMPHLAGANLDIRAVLFAVAVALLAGIVVGTYPVALLLRRGASVTIHGGERTIGAGRQTHAVRSAFVVAQFALALPLLAVAGLLLNSFVRLQRVEPGFDPSKILTVQVTLPSAAYRNDTLIAGYWTRALPLLRQLPGVVEVGLGTSMPPDDNGWSLNNFDLLDRPVPPGTASPMSPWPTVNREYFATLGVRLVEGRLFTAADTGGPAPVVVVSRSWAQRYYPDGTAIGRQLISGGCTTCPHTTVIGVVGDVRYEGLDGTEDAVYGPLTEGWDRNLKLFLRTTTPPAAAAARVRAVLHSVDAAVPLDDIAPMEERLYASISQPRHWTVLLGGFAGAALVLAAVGIFGMLSYTISARRREIGVRMALGARQQSVVAMVVGRGLAHAVVGAALGLLAALVATRALATSLFGISTTDPATLGTVTIMLLVVSVIASWLPARRAAAVDPVDAIRVD